LIFIDFDRVSIFPHPVFQISFCSRSPLPAGGNQPVGYGEPYPAARMADGTLACEHSNYRLFVVGVGASGKTEARDRLKPRATLHH
jgi:hypothetical protein